MELPCVGLFPRLGAAAFGVWAIAPAPLPATHEWSRLVAYERWAVIDRLLMIVRAVPCQPSPYF
jgi:hypothetical protein